MIKAEELRLNNLVLDDDGTVVKIEALETKAYSDWNGSDEFEVRFSKNDELCWASPVFGIPLTEEWLLRFGFVDITPNKGIPYPTFEIIYTHVLVKSRIELQEIDTNMWMWLEGNTNVHIYHVHQLMNLYYALTQTELELKP